MRKADTQKRNCNFTKEKKIYINVKNKNVGFA